jgi:hypothetical protein
MGAAPPRPYEEGFSICVGARRCLAHVLPPCVLWMGDPPGRPYEERFLRRDGRLTPS